MKVWLTAAAASLYIGSLAVFLLPPLAGGASPPPPPASLGAFDINDPDRPWRTNPVARHVAYPVPVNVPTIVILHGYEDDGGEMEFWVKTLPKVGLLYETSQNYRNEGTLPKQAPEPIGPHLLPYKVTDRVNRLIYLPPHNTWSPEGQWGSFEYEAIHRPIRPTSFRPQDPDPAALVSEIGLCVLAGPTRAIAGALFDTPGSLSGWYISGNLAGPEVPGGGLLQQNVVWGGMSNYVYGADAVMYADFVTGLDQTKWYFEASPGFHARELAAAYGGMVKFTIRALYGNFTERNDPLDFITIDCESCNTGQGLKIVRFIDEEFDWVGDEMKVEVPLLPSSRWMKDPQNAAEGFRYANSCEIAAALNNVSRFAILGDFSRAGEGVAIDEVAIVSAPAEEQSKHPTQCQQGCTCRYKPSIRRPQCCAGSNPPTSDFFKIRM